MKKNFYHLTMALTTAAALAACQPQKSAISFEHQGDTLTIVHITNPTKYLILPIQESCNEGKVKLVTGSPADMAMDVRLAVDSVEYYGGKVQGIASIFSFISKARGVEVNSIFDAKDLKGYASYDAKVCPMCKAKQKIDAIVNGYGYSRM